MMWDMSQLYANSGFLSSVVADLASGGGAVTTTAKTTSTTTKVGTTLTTSTKTTTSTAATTTLVPQWGQCGGNGYTGSTQCQPPYTCVATSEWWAQCQ